jgi:hypothetical protein
LQALPGEVMAAAKPRTAVRVNPVTGKMEAVTDEKDGLKRDGCMRLPSKYLTAALDAGLGGANGARPCVRVTRRRRAAPRSPSPLLN